MSVEKIAPRARIAALAILAMTGWAFAPSAAAGPSDDYVSALLGEQLRVERYQASRTVSTHWTAKRTEAPANGARSWNPADQNPWANAYGTPSASYPPHSVRFDAGAWRPVRLCACYLPVETRSWDGGPLTAADVARLCRAQCN
jgi:hypothetical protein